MMDFAPNTEERKLFKFALLVLAALLIAWSSAEAQTWRGIEVAPEFRCSPYDRDDYRYPQSIEADIVQGIGEIYGPYTGRCFNSISEYGIFIPQFRPSCSLL